MISEKRHSNGARKSLSRSHKEAETRKRRRAGGLGLWVFGTLVNASKTCMDFFQEPREQKTGPGCLRGSLFGNGQKFTALIPAPGGDQ